MPKLLVCGRGGSGKSTLVTMLAHRLAEQGKVLVVDADESNLGLGKMLGITPPVRSLMESLGGKKVVGEKLMAAIRSKGTEEVKMFSGSFGTGELLDESVTWDGQVGLLQIGKIQHSKEGCACPMGALAREFLNKLIVGDREWVIVDTEAGLEHFGRGVFEGVDAVLMIVDPSQEAVLLAEKAARLAGEAEKELAVVLNKIDERTGHRLREMLAEKEIKVAAALPYSSDIAEANLVGVPLAMGPLPPELEEIIAGKFSKLTCQPNPGSNL